MYGPGVRNQARVMPRSLSSQALSHILSGAQMGGARAGALLQGQFSHMLPSVCQPPLEARQQSGGELPLP